MSPWPACQPWAPTGWPAVFFSLSPSMSITELIGYVAAFLTTCSFVPQAWHTFRTRDVGGISLGMYSVFTAGNKLTL